MTSQHVPDRTLTLDDIPEIVTVAEAAAAVRMSQAVLKAAIRRGELEAFIPGIGTWKSNPTGVKHAGRGRTYRIHRKALARWYFGDTQ